MAISHSRIDTVNWVLICRVVTDIFVRLDTLFQFHVTIMDEQRGFLFHFFSFPILFPYLQLFFSSSACALAPPPANVAPTMANVTTSFILPDSLFSSHPHPQAFVGVSTVSSGTTAYTINCGTDETHFWPGPNGCDANNSYSFSAMGTKTKTRFLIQKYVKF